MRSSKHAERKKRALTADNAKGGLGQEHGVVSCTKKLQCLEVCPVPSSPVVCCLVLSDLFGIAGFAI